MQTLERQTKDEVAERLIRWHFAVEPEMVEAYRFISENEQDADEPIKLLEVNRATMETGRIDWFPFGPADDISYPSLVAQVTPEEMERIREGAIALPSGWNLSRAERFSSSRHANGSH